MSQYLFFEDLQSIIIALNLQPKKCDYSTLRVDYIDQVEYILRRKCHFNYLGLVIFGVNLEYTKLKFNKYIKYLRLEQVQSLYIPNMNHLLNLQRLEIINNQLNSINKNLPSNIEYLDLSFNILKGIKNLHRLTKLTTLNLSFNCFISDIINIENLTKLTDVNLSNNRILTISGLDKLVNITTLDLSNNKLTKIENLGNLVNLQHLFLNNNKIRIIQNLDHFTQLKTLNLAFNKINKIQNIKYCGELITLDLKNNQIIEIENLERNRCLQVLVLTSNRITDVENIFHLKFITTLELKFNPIINLNIEEIKKSFVNLKDLMLPAPND